MADPLPFPPGGNAGAGAGGDGQQGPDPVALARDANNFGRVAPKFRLGEQTWDVFYLSFKIAASRFVHLDDEMCKNILFSSLQGEALTLACPDFDPTLPDFVNKTSGEYAKDLQELFEPAAESEQMRLEFEHRYQFPGEHPEMYFRDKHRMFNRAYAVPLRDYNLFYDKVITGLINQKMKDSLREFKPVPLNDTKAFREKLIFLANVQRRRLMAGEITEQEALGAEAHASNITYRTQLRTALNPTTPAPPGWKAEGWKVKQEPVYAVNALNPKGTRPRGVCFHCGSKEHFVAQCPRKASGLAPVVNAAEVRDEEEDQVEQEAVQYVRNQNPYRPQQVRRSFGTTGPARTSQGGGYKPSRGATTAMRGRKFNRRIAFIYEDENGQTLHEEIPDHEAGGVQEPAGRVEGVEECTAGVNTLHLDEQPEYYSEGDFIPGAFLGM